MQEASKTKSTFIERTAEMKKELAANAEVRESAPKATRKGAFEKYLRNGMGSLNANERSIMAELRGTSRKSLELILWVVSWYLKISATNWIWQHCSLVKLSV
jgi:hypothetical protein